MKIEMTEKRFTRTESGKSWKSKPYEIKTETITERQYRNITDEKTMRFFRRLGGSEYAERNYTCNGYIITRLISCNPDRTERVERTFNFICD